MTETEIQQQHKQRALIVLASRKNTISYDELMSALSIPDVRQLEDFVIQAISQEIIQGRLNPRERRVEITDWSSKMIGEDHIDLATMEATLSDWIHHCEHVLKSLSDEADNSNQRIADELMHEKRIEDETEKRRRLIFDYLNNFNNGKFLRNENLPGGSTPAKNDAKRYKGAGPLRFRRN